MLACCSFAVLWAAAHRGWCGGELRVCRLHGGQELLQAAEQVTRRRCANGGPLSWRHRSRAGCRIVQPQLLDCSTGKEPERLEHHHVAVTSLQMLSNMSARAPGNSHSGMLC